MPSLIDHTIHPIIRTTTAMPSKAARQWWRRAAAAAKDKRSLCLARVAAHGGMCNSDMEAAVIRATSHDDRALDYKNARRVFAWARAAPAAFLSPLMWAIARRASRTRCWAVALKSLLLAHGLLLCSSAAASAPVVGRLPFDLSDFHDRSPRFWGHSAFIRAYFSFLDHRSLYIAYRRRRADEDESDGLERVEKLQALLDLLMQIRPYGDGMEIGLIREAMDCALIEIFDVYSGICNGIASFLAGYMKGGSSSSSSPQKNGLLGIQVVRRASEQIDQLSAYFELCRRLGVPNADGLPPVEKIPEEDILNLEKVVMKGLPMITEGGKELISNEVAAEKWVVFDNADDKGKGTGNGGLWNLLDSPPPETLASMVQHRDTPFKYEIGNLIEL